MEEPNDHNMPPPQPARSESFLRRLGRGFIQKVFPYQIRPYHAPETDPSAPDVATLGLETQPPVESEEASDSPIVIALSQDGTSLHFLGNDNRARFESTAPHGLKTLFPRFSKMYLAVGEGEFSSAKVAQAAGYQPGTVTDTVWKLGESLPPEAFSYQRAAEGPGLQLFFGNIALACIWDATSEGISAVQNKNRQKAAEIDRDKIELGFYDHALIRRGDASYYLALHSPEALIAARVLEALSGLREDQANSARVAEAVWEKMTVAERLPFAQTRRNALLDNGSIYVEEQVLLVLRRLTNQLLLTLEPRGDRFTLMTKGLSIAYQEDPISQEFMESNPTLRPILPPHEKELMKLEPGKRTELIQLAKLYVTRTRNQIEIEDTDAIAMLDFIMSSAGRWAINQISGTPEGYGRPATALRAMHRYLRRTLRGAYGSAYRNRLITGNRMVRGRGVARQVSGGLPSETKWGLGRTMNEVLFRTFRTLQDSGSEDQE